MGLYSYYDTAAAQVGTRPDTISIRVASLGHLIQGKQPAFLNNPVQVLVSPLWLAREVFRGRRPQE